MWKTRTHRHYRTFHCTNAAYLYAYILKVIPLWAHIFGNWLRGVVKKLRVLERIWLLTKGVSLLRCRLYTYALTGSVPGLHFSRTTRLWLHAFSWSERSLVLYQVYTSQGGGQGYGYGCMLSAGASGHGLVLPYMHSDLVFG